MNDKLFYCHLYEGNMNQFDCGELCMGADFKLPFDLPDEDEQPVTPVDDLFRQIYKECKYQPFP